MYIKNVYQLDFTQIRFAKIGMKLYGGESSSANKTENDKKYSSIFHDLKFSYVINVFMFINTIVHIFNKFNKK